MYSLLYLFFKFAVQDGATSKAYQKAPPRAKGADLSIASLLEQRDEGVASVPPPAPPHQQTARAGLLKGRILNPS